MTKKEYTKYVKNIDVGVLNIDCVIYALCEPDTGEIRYIGQSFNLPARMAAHFYEETSPQKLRWIQLLRMEDKFPLIKILELIKPQEKYVNITEIEINYALSAKKDGCKLFNTSGMPKEGECSHYLNTTEVMGDYIYIKCSECKYVRKAVFINCHHVFERIAKNSNKFICVKCGEVETRFINPY